MDDEFDGVALNALIPPVQPLLDLGARQYGAGRLNESAQQRKLTWSDRDGLRVATNSVSHGIQNQFPVHNLGSRTAVMAAQQASQARLELRELEWLHQVVIRSAVQAID